MNDDEFKVYEKIGSILRCYEKALDKRINIFDNLVFFDLSQSSLELVKYKNTNHLSEIILGFPQNRYNKPGVTLVLVR